MGDARDARTGAPVHSLFGPTRAPTDAMLEGADTLVVDLADVGVRFYTYASTTRRAMEAAAARGMRVVILDRPDPLGGGEPRGPVCEPSLASFVNHHTLPRGARDDAGRARAAPRRRARDRRAAGLVGVEGWRRSVRFDDTGLRGAALAEPAHAGAGALVPGARPASRGPTSPVGRGTDAPFEQIGAPWMDPRAVLAELGALEGARVEAVRFVPRSARHRGASCRGLRICSRIPRASTRCARASPSRAPPARAPGRLGREAMLPMIGDREVHRALLAGAEVASSSASPRRGCAPSRSAAPGFLRYE
ncbi:MAG: DUF1343 domain-containing protein [Sandaracinaceae bacterium]|nr:DUF1343 domain-containing protein [Sandaracinaceae bacterium]